MECNSPQKRLVAGLEYGMEQWNGFYILATKS